MTLTLHEWFFKEIITSYRLFIENFPKNICKLKHMCHQKGMDIVSGIFQAEKIDFLLSGRV
jgi:isochorismate hydrolase